jgi:hypothetical protein
MGYYAIGQFFARSEDLFGIDTSLHCDAMTPLRTSSAFDKEGDGMALSAVTFDSLAATSFGPEAVS